MIRIKKWMIMSVLLIISLTTINVNATTYTAYDTPMSSQYSDFFENYFKDKHFTYFTYRCNYGGTERSCYYGIDLDTKKYINFIYTQVSSSWVIYSQVGTDNSFNVNGNTVVIRGETYQETINKNLVKKTDNLEYYIIFIFVFAVFLKLTEGMFNDNF